MSLDSSGLAKAIYYSGLSDRIPPIAELTLSELRHLDPKVLKEYAKEIGIAVEDNTSSQPQFNAVVPMAVKQDIAPAPSDTRTKPSLPAPMVFISAI